MRGEVGGRSNWVAFGCCRVVVWDGLGEWEIE